MAYIWEENSQEKEKKYIWETISSNNITNNNNIVAPKKKKNIVDNILNVGETTFDTIGGAATDILRGGYDIIEGAVDFTRNRVGNIGGALGFKDFENELYRQSEMDVSSMLFGASDKLYDKNIVKEGSLPESVLSGVGQLVPLIGSTMLGIPAPVAIGVSSAGGAEQEALKSGADRGNAALYSIPSGVVSAGTEYISGGIGGIFGKGAIDDIVTDKITKSISNQVTKKITELGIKASFEGLEENIEGMIDPYLRRMTFDPNAKGYFTNENGKFTLNKAGRDFLVATLVSTIVQAPSVVMNNNTQNVQDKLPMSNETPIGNDNIPTQDKIPTNGIKTEIIAPIESGVIVEKIGKPLTLEESIEKYFDKTNPTTIQLQDNLQKISANRNLNILFDEDVKGNGLIEIDEMGNRTIRLNPNSDRVLEFTLVHELVHDFEGTPEYDALKQAVEIFDSKNAGFEQARANLQALYTEHYEKNGLDISKLNIDSEATADILGKVLGNQEFVTRLSIEQPNVFQKVLRWINNQIELLKSSNKEQTRFLQDVKAKFEEAYRQNAIRQEQQVRQSINKDSKQMIEQQFEKLTGDSIMLAETKLGGMELRNNKRTDGQKEPLPYSQEAMQLLKKYNNSKQSSAFLYHSTKQENLQNILQNGLTSNNEARQNGVSGKGKIYLAANEDLANLFGENSDIIIRIDSKYKFSDLENDLLGGEGTYATNKNIPVDALQVKENGKWVMLKNSSLVKQIAPISKENTIQGLENYSRQEIKDITLNHIQNIINESGEDINVIDLEIIGSRNRGNAKKTSDLDIVVEYDGDIREDSMFNMLNDDKLIIDGVEVDINPITASKTGTLENYMKKSNAYDQEVLNKNQDSTGKTLSKQTTEYFKDSKVRDDKGRLLEVYHATNADFNEFDTKKIGSTTDDGIWGMGFYFANKDTRNVYGKNLKKVYLNIKNPLVMSDFKSIEEIADYLDMSESNFVIDNTYGIPRVVYSQTRQFTSQLQLKGHDGVIAKSKDGWTEYVAFEPNQIKAVDNIAPTTKDDIRYSISETKDNKGRTLTKEQKELADYVSIHMKDNQGRLLTMYHGSPSDFNEFDFDKIGESSGTGYGRGFYFTDNEEMAKSYGNTKEYYLFLEKPLILKDTDSTQRVSSLDDPKVITREQFSKILDELYSKDKYAFSNYGDVDYEGKTTVKNKILKDLMEDGSVEAINGIYASGIASMEDVFEAVEKITGYDGIVVYKDSEVLKDAKTFKEFISFNPNKIKLTSNKTPNLEEKDIRLSQSQEGKWQERLDTVYNFNVKPGTMLGDIKLDTKQAKIMSERPKPTHESIPSDIDKVIQQTVNRGHYVDKLSKATGNKELTFKYDKMLSAVAEGHYVIGVAQTDNNGKKIGKSINEIWKPVEDSGKVEEFSYYLLHKHNIDRSAQSKPVFSENVTSEMSKEIVANYENSNPKFVKWAKDINTFNKNQLQNMVDAGLTSVETQELLNNMYDNYVRIQRNGKQIAPITNQNGKLKIKNPLRKATGGNADILPLKDSMASQAIEIKNAVRRNDFGLELYKTIGGESISDYDLKKLIDKTEDGKFTYTVFEKGQPISIKIDEGLYESLKPSVKGDWESLAPVQLVQKGAKLQRGTLTIYSPYFIATNFFKDFQDGIFNSKYSSKFVRNYVNAISEIKNNGKLWQLYQANGGNQNTYFDYDKGVIKQDSKGIKKFIDKIISVNEIVEQAPRLAEFISTIQDGKTITEAMYNAAEVTTNFKRGGDITKAINRNGANFLNASIQGLDKQFRNITGANGVKGYVNLLAKATMLGVIPSVLNHLLLSDDDDYEELPDYVKDTFFLFKVGDNKFIRIPKGRVLSIFGAAARRTLELASGEEDAFEGFGQTITNQLAPNNPLEDNIIAPLMDAKDNKTWFGGEIVPTRLQDELPKNQWDETTDSFSKWLGEQLNISPKKINYVLDQYSGAIGDTLLPLMTPKAEPNPLLAKFTSDSVLNNKNVQDFFTTKEELTKVANDTNATNEEKLMVKYLNRVQAKANDLYAEKREIELSDMKDSAKRTAVRELQDQINQIMKSALNTYENIDLQSNYAKIGDYEWYLKGDEWETVTKDQQEDNAKLDELNFDYNDYYGEYVKLNAIRYNDNLESEEKKNKIIDGITQTNLTSDQKLYMYNKYYSSDKKINAITKVGIEADIYLELEKNIINISAKDDPKSNIEGKTISGSKKTQVMAVVQKLPTTRANKLILMGMQGYSLTSNEKTEVFNYINNLRLTASDKKTILEEINSFQWLESGNLKGW